MNVGRKFFSLVCDDVREERGNKQTLVGVYADEIVVRSFPTLFPRLMVYTRITTPASEPFESLTVRVFVDETVIGEAPIDTGNLPPGNENTDVITYNVVMAFSPLGVDKPVTLKAEVEAEDGKICTTNVVIRSDGTTTHPNPQG